MGIKITLIEFNITVFKKDKGILDRIYDDHFQDPIKKLFKYIAIQRKNHNRIRLNHKSTPQITDTTVNAHIDMYSYFIAFNDMIFYNLGSRYNVLKYEKYDTFGIEFTLRDSSIVLKYNTDMIKNLGFRVFRCQNKLRIMPSEEMKFYSMNLI